MTKRYLVTGGAGFIGCNYVHRLLGRGARVTVYDNLSRRGTEANVAWLREQHGAGSFRLVVGDVRDCDALAEAMQDADVVVHLAGQTAVTTSVTDPRSDLEHNVLGTFNALEAARHAGTDPIFLYASTNKVYGGMEDVPVVERETRYAYRDFPHGIPETQPLDCHSPYGCSKGAGDQYVRDYARIYGLPTVVLRQSCVYGPRQMGVEDQGWVAWFIIAAVTGQPITIYGDGKQVRDVLFVDDLLDVYDAAVAHVDVAAGQVYNVGGGPLHTMSVWAEFGPILERLMGCPIPVSYADWRPGDQRIYVSDVRKAGRELGWRPRVDVEEGVRRLYQWVVGNRGLFEASPPTSSSTSRGDGEEGRGGKAVPPAAYESASRRALDPAFRRRRLELARAFRKEPTQAEAVLWEALRNRRCGGLKFRRQHPLHGFLVDFYCAKHRLVVEVEGEVHRFQQEADQIRQRILETEGYTVLRFSNEEVLAALPVVLERICSAVGASPLSPSRSNGEGGWGGEAGR